MKVNKYLFGTVCAAAMFASCTNEELISVVENGEIDAKQVDVVLKANFSEREAESRMALIGNEWAWINGDKIGALRVGDKGNTASNSFTTNYPFELTEELSAPSKSADFKTNTAVFEGNYVFYHQYNGSMVSGGKSFEVTFPAVQQINPDSLTENLSANNIFVSPVVKIEGLEYEKANETAIDFVPLYAMLEVKVTNNSTEGNVVLNRVDITGDNITPKGDLDFKTNAKFPVVDPTEDDYANELAKAIEDMNKAHDLLASGATLGEGQTISAVVKGNGIAINNGETKSVYVLIPAGSYTINSSASNGSSIEKFTIYTDKGQFTVNAEAATTAGTAMNNVTFNHKSLRSLNPKLTGKASDVAEYSINNNDDWNNAVAYALANQNKEITFELNTDITVSELPSCAIYTGGDGKLIFAKDSKINLAQGSTFNNKVENNGTLNLIEKSEFTDLVNNGTINIAASENIASPITFTNNGTVDLYGKMTTATGWSNNYDSKNTFGTINVKEGANLIIGDATQNAGIINNAGKITTNGVLTNANEINVTTATGTIVGNGIAYKIVNNHTINLDAIKDIFVDDKGKAVNYSFIDNTSTGSVNVAVTPADIANLPAIQEINAIEMSGDWTVKNVKDMNYKWPGITSMTWNSVNLDLKDVTKEEFTKISSLEINGTSSIINSGTDDAELGLNKEGSAGDTTIKVNGNLTVGNKITIGYFTEKGIYPVMTVLGSVVNNGRVYVDLTVGAKEPQNTTAKFTNKKDAFTNIVSEFSNGIKYTDLKLYGIFVNEGAKANVTTSAVNFLVQGKSTFTGEYTVKAE